jgi:hypothetical protein
MTPLTLHVDGAAPTAARQLAELGHAGYGEQFASEVLEEMGETGRSITLALADVKVRWRSGLT